MHIYIHAYIHTCTHTHIHTYIHTHTHKYIHTYTHIKPNKLKYLPIFTVYFNTKIKTSVPFQFSDPRILGSNVQNVFARDTSTPDFWAYIYFSENC
jgi:hypothetical protein